MTINKETNHEDKDAHLKEFYDAIHEEAANLANLLQMKNKAYGNSFNESQKIIEILYPDGVSLKQYLGFLTMVRIIDKLFRIATDPDAFNEDAWQDIAGYALLQVANKKSKKGVSMTNGNRDFLMIAQRTCEGDLSDVVGDDIPVSSYRKKPVCVQAAKMNKYFAVTTLDGVMNGKPGDYLIRGVQGEIYPCKAEIFEKTYETT